MDYWIKEAWRPCARQKILESERDVLARPCPDLGFSRLLSYPAHCVSYLVPLGLVSAKVKIETGAMVADCVVLLLTTHVEYGFRLALNTRHTDLIALLV